MKKVIKEDWSILIILDACRYDAFQECLEKYPLFGKLLQKESRGTATESWRRANFNKESECSDIVLVSGNPQMSEYKQRRDFNSRIFKRIYEVWKSDWNEDLNAVRPEDVTNWATTTYRYLDEDERLMIHYLQPHFPPLKNPKLAFGRGLRWSYEESVRNQSLSLEEIGEDRGVVFQYVRDGMIDLEDLVRAYYQNLKLVMDEVIRFLKAVNLSREKVVITADHGELLGSEEDDDMLGHGDNLEHPNLRKIPWFEIEEIEENN